MAVAIRCSASVDVRSAAVIWSATCVMPCGLYGTIMTTDLLCEPTAVTVS